jgi:hypothetical protein
LLTYRKPTPADKLQNPKGEKNKTKHRKREPIEYSGTIFLLKKQNKNKTTFLGPLECLVDYFQLI